MNTGDLQGWIERAATGGWDWFGEAPGATKEQVSAAKVRDEERRNTIANAWKRFAATPDGKMALQTLLDGTVNRAVPPAVTMGFTIDQVAMYSVYREGQNNIAQAILKLIAAGRDPDEQPKPRDLT